MKIGDVVALRSHPHAPLTVERLTESEPTPCRGKLKDRARPGAFGPVLCSGGFGHDGECSLQQPPPEPLVMVNVAYIDAFGTLQRSTVDARLLDPHAVRAQLEPEVERARDSALVVEYAIRNSGVTISPSFKPPSWMIDAVIAATKGLT